MKNFFQQVYEIVAKIPKGKVATYGQIAIMLGNPRGARAVGWAMKAIPKEIDIPWHRVVNKKGCCVIEYQKEILEGEGIIFLDNNCVDMKKHIWKQ